MAHQVSRDARAAVGGVAHGGVAHLRRRPARTRLGQHIIVPPRAVSEVRRQRADASGETAQAFH